MINFTSIDRLRLQRGAEHLHCLGPRACAEVLAEIGAQTGAMRWIIDRLGRYTTLTPEMMRKTGGDRFAPRVRVVSQ